MSMVSIDVQGERIAPCTSMLASVYKGTIRSKPRDFSDFQRYPQ